MMRGEQSIYKLRLETADKPKPIYYYDLLLIAKQSGKMAIACLLIFIYPANYKLFTHVSLID
ncbi:hypothetical protein [Nostoc sp. MS1]|uniref:hypothetical protein n=1 Tax=Nostoc sp. MS1 TaxID=2764711 RepID=UPI001CC5667D|nr:hypothetical protein [Nostoc sp. MS1]